MAPKPFLITGLRGRNDSDAPVLLPDDQCVEAQNVDLDGVRLGSRRAGSTSVALTFSSGGPFSTQMRALFRHLPGTDENAAELWAIDVGGTIGRLAASALWTAVTKKDAFAAPTVNVHDTTAVSAGGKFWVTYDSAVNRSQVWDGTSVRRRGVAPPAAPTTATLGGAGLSFTRHYRVRWVEISGTDTVRRSEPSASDDLTITDDAGVRVTRPTVASEGETHWEVEYADAAAGPWYRVAQVLVGTSTYDDTDATVDSTLPLSDEAGVHTPPPSFKITVKAGGRLLNAGCWETSAGDSFVPKANEVYWTPVEGATDVGDLERQPPTYRVTLDHAVLGLSQPLNGIVYAFGYRGLSALVETDAGGEGAFRRITERLDLGCIRHHTIVTGEDEFGRACIYFLSHLGPYRIGPSGMQYLGRDLETLWARVNLDASTIVAHGLYDADRKVVVYWVAVDGALAPTVRLRFFTQLGRSAADEVRGGWVKDAGGLACSTTCSVAFSASVGASMGRPLVPYWGSQADIFIFRHDAAATDDAGEDFQAYIETKEYAPAGLGRNCALLEPYLIAEADAAKVVSVQVRTDFGRTTPTPDVISLAPEFTETHVQRKVSGLEHAGLGTLRLRIGDAQETDPGFGVLDAVVAQYEPENAR